MKIYSRYEDDRVVHEVVFDPKKDRNSVSMTNQADKDSADINKIIARFERTGNILDLVSGESRQPVYGDFTGLGDYHSMMCAIARANSVFMALSSDIRKRFNNDPGELIDFLKDDKNDAEAVKLGLKDYETALCEVSADGKPITGAAKSAEVRAAVEAAKGAASVGAAGGGNATSTPKESV